MLEKLFRLFGKQEDDLKLEMIDTLMALKKETANTQAVIDYLNELNKFVFIKL